MSKNKVIRRLVPPMLWDSAARVRRALRNSRLGLTADDPRVESLRSDFQALNESAPFRVMILRPGIDLRIHPDSREPFEYFCFRSPEMVDELSTFLAETTDCLTFLDIGSLHGVFAIAFGYRNRLARSLAIDASPRAFATLLYNIAANNLMNVKPIECAVSNTSGYLSMHYEWEHAVAGRGTDPSSLLTVVADTGDSICMRESFFPDSVKIDVEGHEWKVLRGLAQTLQHSRPKLFLELHPGRIREEGDSLADVCDFLERLEYVAKTPSGVHPVSIFREMACDTRVVLIPQEKASSSSTPAA